MHPSREEKNRSRIEWTDQLLSYFEFYRDEKIIVPIRGTLYTVQVLANVGLIDDNNINPDDKINVMDSKHSHNERLVYNCFDWLIEKNEHLKDYLQEFKYEYNNEMPY